MTMRTTHHCLNASLVIALAALGVPAPVHAQGLDPRAFDAIDLFADYCLTTAGSREKAIAAFDGGEAPANRVPDDVVQKMQEGEPGGVAWGMRGMGSAGLLLEYRAIGLCIVRVVEADEISMRQAFAMVAQATASGLGGDLVADSPLVKLRDGRRLTYQVYRTRFCDRNVHLAITTADRRMHPQQHFMSLAFVK